MFRKTAANKQRLTSGTAVFGIPIVVIMNGKETLSSSIVG